MCSAVVAASLAATASSSAVVSTANNAPVPGSVAIPIRTHPPPVPSSSSSSSRSSVAHVASRPDSVRVAPRSARIKPFVARTLATETSSSGCASNTESTSSPASASSIATHRTELGFDDVDAGLSRYPISLDARGAERACARARCVCHPV